MEEIASDTRTEAEKQQQPLHNHPQGEASDENSQMTPEPQGGSRSKKRQRRKAFTKRLTRLKEPASHMKVIQKFSTTAYDIGSDFLQSKCVRGRSLSTYSKCMQGESVNAYYIRIVL